MAMVRITLLMLVVLALLSVASGDNHGDGNAKRDKKSDGEKGKKRVKCHARKGDISITCPKKCGHTFNDGMFPSCGGERETTFYSVEEEGVTNVAPSTTDFAATNTFNDPLFSVDNKPAGYVTGLCTFVNLAKQPFEQTCFLTFVFPDGTVTAQGQFKDVKTVLAVTGGTEKYFGAYGELKSSTVASTSDGNTFLYQYKLKIRTRKD